MIDREIMEHLITLFRQYPFVTVTGPRQSGKTTLCRTAFPDLAYANLETPDQREFAEADPRGFLSQFGEGAVLDEIQHVPALLSYLQVLADERGSNSLFVLTGSEQFKLSDAISQSLAGRTALLRLLPFSLAERQQTGASVAVDDILYSGFYPRILDQDLDPRQALGDYLETYVERDVRRIGEIRNLSGFRRFVRLCAGRVGQLVNLTALGADAGVSHTTARQWLTVLETSYIIFQLQPFHANIRKRLVKSPKLYFYDVGLASYLLGIEYVEQIATHPLRGALFENTVVTETLKYRFNRGHQSNLSFFRDARGLECDLFYQMGHGIGAIEIKSGATITSDYFQSLNRVAELVPGISGKAIVYGGKDRQSRSGCEVVPLGDLHGVLERFEVDREIAAFVKDHKRPEPSTSDLRTLDIAYRTHIRPVLDGLDYRCKQVEELFHNIDGFLYITSGGQSNSFLSKKAPNWESMKKQYIAVPGFTLAADRPLELRHDYIFRDYNGRHQTGFSVTLSIVWELDASYMSRRVTIDETPFGELENQVHYSELESRSAEVNHTVTEIVKQTMDRIEFLSGR